MHCWKYITDIIGQRYYSDKIHQIKNNIQEKVASRPSVTSAHTSLQQEAHLATRLINEMNVAINSHLAPGLTCFCRRINLRPLLNGYGCVRDVDAHGYLKALRSECYKDRRFLAGRTTGTNEYTRRQLTLALIGRNAVSHGKRQEVLNSWKRFMASWSHVLEKIKRYDEAEAVRQISANMIHFALRR